jgi:hypothetical protein
LDGTVLISMFRVKKRHLLYVHESAILFRTARNSTGSPSSDDLSHVAMMA